ncbi:MAG TPA: hypothetical protein VL980_01530 [Gemmatimonadaceae bacterium]|nr:hypothetical protein [Gemmatimonadaceae bacterium]
MSASFASSSRFSNRAIDCSTSRRVAADLAEARARTVPPEGLVERLVERAAGRAREVERVVDFAADLLVDLRAAGIASPCLTERV